MSNARKTPMTAKRARKVQSDVDRKPNPTLQQVSFKRRTSSAAEKNKKPW